MEEQELPLDKISCPDCDAEPTHESIVKHNLSDMGYFHDDAQMECRDCGTTWTHGLPIGEYTEGEDLWCKVCDDSYRLVHRIKLVETDAGMRKYRLHTKCPNCYHFRRLNRESDENGLALVGYPHITGDVDGAEDYGYSDGSPTAD